MRNEQSIIEDLILKNKSYQAAIIRQLTALQRAIDQCDSTKIRIFDDFKTADDRSRTVNDACYTVRLKSGFEEEVLVRPSHKISYWTDTQELKPCVPPDSVRVKKWTAADRQKLRECIRQQRQQWLFQNLAERQQLATSEEIHQISCMTPEELERDVSHVEWDSLASSVFPGRSVVELMHEWLLHLAPDVKRGPFEPQEVQELMRYRQHAHTFVDIGRRLNRLPIDCLRQFVQKGATNRGKWTPEEDDVLRRSVAVFGNRNWSRIASELPGRTGQQCLHRWNKTLNPNIKRGKWTYDEDRRLALAVAAFGKHNSNWSAIQKLVPNRTDVQCRERWMNVLNPQINNEQWRPEEDDLLMQLTERIGPGKWASVSRKLNKQLNKISTLNASMRTDNQCWRRWKMLNKNN